MQSDRSVLYTVIGTIVGTLVGALASFLGTYFIFQSQSEQQHEDRQRASYVKLATESERYRLLLVRLRQAAIDKDEKRYIEREEELRNQSTVMYSAWIECSLLLDDEEEALAGEIVEAYYLVPIPPDIEDVDLEAIDRGNDAGREASERFINEGERRYGDPAND